MKSAVLVSGGIDSATCLASACSTSDEVIPVFIGYNQETEMLERKMAKNQVDHLDGEYSEVDMLGLRILDYTSVFSHFADGVMMDKDFSHLKEDDGRSSGYVPMRNLHFIATAAGIADVEGAENVYYGAQMGDDDAYPDCRPEFVDKAAGAISKSVPNGQVIDLKVPLLHLSKGEVVERALEYGVDFEYTYSCYEDTDLHDPEPCGECPACEERAQAFREAGIVDPHNTHV